MEQTSTMFEQSLNALHHWKANLFKNISLIRSNLSHNNELSKESEKLLEKLHQNLKQNHKAVLAIVGEGSRGKSELINAFLYSKYERRLLPSYPGKTTLCPTELFFDLHSQSSFIKLLPIETKVLSKNLSELKAEPQHWEEFPLKDSDPQDTVEKLKQVSDFKSVSKEEAKNLQFDLGNLDINPDNPSEYLIPVWRHAMISCDHPLLRQGLVIIDTPGLNAFGSEPQLTLDLLPQASAALFVMNADTGPTLQDLQLWEKHIYPLFNQININLYVALNKADTLWDDYTNEENEQKNNFVSQIHSTTARKLNLPEAGIITISAKKALQARHQNDQTLLQKSHLPQLETLLSTGLVKSKESQIRKTVINPLLRILLSERRSMLEKSNQLDHIEKQNFDLKHNQSFQNQKKHIEPEKKVKLLQNSQKLLLQQLKALEQRFNEKSAQKKVAEAQSKIHNTFSKKYIMLIISALLEVTRNDTEKLRNQALLAKQCQDQLARRHQLPKQLLAQMPKLKISIIEELVLSLFKRTQTLQGNFIRTQKQTEEILIEFSKLAQDILNVYKEANAMLMQWYTCTIKLFKTHTENELQIATEAPNLPSVLKTQEILALRRKLKKNIQFCEHMTESLALPMSHFQHSNTNKFTRPGSSTAIEFLNLTNNSTLIFS